MNNITLPDYWTSRGNEIFVGSAEPIYREGKSVEAVSVARLVRFRRPLPGEVLDSIQEHSADLFNPGGKTEDSVHKTIRECFSGWIISDFAMKGRNFDYTKRDLEKKFRGGGYNLTFSRGIIPKTRLGDFYKGLDEHGGEFYPEFIDDEGQRTWGLSLRLPEIDKLPDFSKLEGFLSHGTSSPVLEVAGDFRNYQDVRDQIIDIYNSLNPNDLSNVKNASQEGLDTASKDVVKWIADLTRVRIYYMNVGGVSVYGMNLRGISTN